MVGVRGNDPDGRRGRAWRSRWSDIAIAVVVAGWCWWQPGLAAGTAMAGVTLQYTCTVGAPMTARATWHLPTRIVVGRPTPAVRLTVAATISAANTAVFGFAGVASIDGRGDAAAAVAAPQGTVDTALHLIVPRTPVPVSGAMTFHAAGTLAIPVFRQPGHAVVDVGTTLDLTLTPRDANGSPMVGAIAEPCTLNSGQDRELFSFGIRSAPHPVTSRVTLPPAPAAAAAGTPGHGTANAGGSRSSKGGPSTTGPAASSSAPPTTLTPTSIPATSGPARDSAAVSNRRSRPADWWLSVVATMGVVVSAVGGVRWLRHRRRMRGL